MGRYENALKYVQLRSMIEEKKFEEALQIAEQLEMGRIKDVSELKLIADVYRKCGKYDRAKELYYVIYQEHKIRKNLYTLIMICLKDKSFDEAEGLFKEYITIDKDSIFRYILRYRIDKSRNTDINVVIKDLEDIKKAFYMEDWGYELAKMYHKAGRIDDCLAECDDLILWFGEGEVVEKARLLKMHYDENIEEDILNTLQNSIGNDISRYMDTDDEEAEKSEKSDEEEVDSRVTPVNREELDEQQEYPDVCNEGSDNAQESDDVNTKTDKDIEVSDEKAISGTDNEENYVKSDIKPGIKSWSDSIYNDTYNEKLKNDALSEAAGFKNVMLEAARANQQEVEVVAIGGDEPEAGVAATGRDEQEAGVAATGRDDTEAGAATGRDEPEAGMAATGGDKPEATVQSGIDGSLDIDDGSAPGDRTEGENAGTGSAAADGHTEFVLSKYGSRFNYIDAEALYNRLNIGIHAPATYAIALGNSDSASDIVREIAQKVKAHGYLRNPKIARISASKLNNIRLYDQIEELLGTCMLIENASEMSSKTVNVIIKIMDAHASEVVMIFVDEEEKISRFMLKEPILCNQIDNFVLK